jgi:hypothetical protein
MSVSSFIYEPEPDTFCLDDYAGAEQFDALAVYGGPEPPVEYGGPEPPVEYGGPEPPVEYGGPEPPQFYPEPQRATATQSALHRAPLRSGHHTGSVSQGVSQGIPRKAARRQPAESKPRLEVLPSTMPAAERRKAKARPEKLPEWFREYRKRQRQAFGRLPEPRNSGSKSPDQGNLFGEIRQIEKELGGKLLAAPGAEDESERVAERINGLARVLGLIQMLLDELDAQRAVLASGEWIEIAHRLGQLQMKAVQLAKGSA